MQGTPYTVCVLPAWSLREWCFEHSCLRTVATISEVPAALYRGGGKVGQALQGNVVTASADTLTQLCLPCTSEGDVGPFDVTSSQSYRSKWPSLPRGSPIMQADSHYYRRVLFLNQDIPLQLQPNCVQTHLYCDFPFYMNKGEQYILED